MSQQLLDADNEPARRRMMSHRACCEDFLDEVLTEGKALYEHPYRASPDIRLQSTRQWNAQSWCMREDIGALQSAYVDSLIRLEKAARAAERSRDANSLNTSLMVVIEKANRLGFLGYRINWEQNARWALRATRYGLSDYAVVDVCDPDLDRINLTERLAVLGTLTFWKQQRRNGKLADPIEVAFSKSAEKMYGAVKLVRGELVGSRYASDWFADNKEGMHYRILSD